MLLSSFLELNLYRLPFAPFRVRLTSDLLLSFTRMALPPSLLKQLWEAGYGGKVIRVPAKNERLELKVIANEILKNAERLYESKGTTFVLERRGRSDFYRSFGALKLCRRFHLSIVEARKVRRRAYSRWSHWVRGSEANVLRAADKFGESGEGRQRYLEVRGRVRGGEDVHGVDGEILEMAWASIRSVKWN
jgi:hypothetical protein